MKGTSANTLQKTDVQTIRASFATGTLCAHCGQEKIKHSDSLRDKEAKFLKGDIPMEMAQSLVGIEIAIEGKAKSQTYIGMSNPYLWKALIHYVRQIPESDELPTADIEVKLN